MIPQRLRVSYTMSRPYDVMVAGHLCLDIIPQFPDTGVREIGKIVQPGKLVNVTDAIVSTGGPVSNTGIGMKKLGNRVCFCARLGDDAFGEITSDILRSQGNAEGIRIVEGTASSYTVVVAPPNIDRCFLHNPGTNDQFGSEDLDPKLIEQCRHFHFGYPPLMRRMQEDDGAELVRLFRIAKEAGATTSCDLSLPDPHSQSGMVNWRLVLEAAMEHIDLLLPSIEEALFMVDRDGYMRLSGQHGGAGLIDHVTPGQYALIADELLGLGAKVVALKSGPRGIYVKTQSRGAFGGLGAAKPGDVDNWSDRELWAPALAVPKPPSATGAGDVAIAGFLTGFLRGLSIEQTLRCGTCCGWQNVQVPDAISGVGTWEETIGVLDRDMPLIDAKIDDDGWAWSEDQKVWTGPNDPLQQA